MNILIVEDEEQLALSLKKLFQEEGHSATLAFDGERGWELLQSLKFDIILLDWVMPKMNGIDLCRKLRAAGISTPVILLTALSNVNNVVEGLNHGADDYVTKPFLFDELIARVNAVTRRFDKSNEVIHFDVFALDLIGRKLESAAGVIKLTEKEFDLLKLFLNNRNRIISKETIIKEVWGLDFVPQTNFVEASIKNIRKRLSEFSDKKFIRNVYGEGYFFSVDE